MVAKVEHFLFHSFFFFFYFFFLTEAEILFNPTLYLMAPHHNSVRLLLGTVMNQHLINLAV